MTLTVEELTWLLNKIPRDSIILGEEVWSGPTVAFKKVAAQHFVPELNDLDGVLADEEFKPLDMILTSLERKQRIDRIRKSLAAKRRARALLGKKRRG